MATRYRLFDTRTSMWAISPLDGKAQWTEDSSLAAIMTGDEAMAYPLEEDDDVFVDVMPIEIESVEPKKRQIETISPNKEVYMRALKSLMALKGRLDII